MNGTIRFIPNPGNAGDALIAAGTWQCFDDLNLRPVVSTVSDIRPGDIVIYPGGGNLVPYYENCAKVLQTCLRVGVRSALVLPHTIFGHEALLTRLDERFLLVCREHESLARVRANAPRAGALIAPDMALRIDVERLYTRCDRLRNRLRYAKYLACNRKTRYYLSWRQALASLEAGTDGTMYVIRADVEAVAAIKGAPQWDVSGLYLSAFTSREEADFIARDLLVFVCKARRVVTNRLHAGIAAALVGCRVTLIDNSYGKIRAVYETSLKNLEHVTFASS